MNLTAEQAIKLLDALARGDASALSIDGVRALTKNGLAVAFTPLDLSWMTDREALLARQATIDAPGLKALVADLDLKLRSDMHRVFSSRATLDAEERDRSRARRLLSILADARRAARFTAAARARASLAGPALKITAGQNELTVGISASGMRALVALRARKASIQDVPQFLKGFAKAEVRMAQLAADTAALERDLPAVPKGRSAVLVGLLKTGLSPAEALARYGEASQHVMRGDKESETPHLAVGAIRATAANTNGGVAVAEATELQRKAYQALKRANMSTGPVLRGAVRAVIAEPDLDAAVARFVAVHHALCKIGVKHEDAQRHAARLLALRDDPDTLAKRVAHAADELLAQKLRNTATVTPEAVALASIAKTDRDVPTLVEKLKGLSRELRRQDGVVNGPDPDGLIELVAVPGTAGEVIALVHQMVTHLDPKAPPTNWAASSTWAVACAFARRYAY